MARIRQIAMLLTVLSCATLLSASEKAVLRNGFSLIHDHRDLRGPVTRLYLSPTEETFIDVPNDQIIGIEKLDPDEEVFLKPPASVPAPVADKDLDAIIAAAAKRHNIDADFIRSVVKAESGGRANAVSVKGAQGLMQLMPKTANLLGVNNSFDPEANVEAGTRYLRELLARYNNDPIKALAAYNAGALRVQQYHGVPPYHETHAYIRKIINDYNRQKRAGSSQKSAAISPPPQSAAQPAAAD
jgi:soluble lytic murein transglycosylase-like protein